MGALTEERFSLESTKKCFESYLEGLLRKSSYPDPALYEGARYMLLDGGKRLRPLLSLAVGHTLGASPEALMQPAAALEMVHTYSLIHDDLPCMDNDDFRRGKPTLHRAYGEATALLIGDFLLTYAFETLAKSPHLSAETQVRLMIALSESAGSGGMVGGQALDLAKSPKKEEIARKKTGKLFQAAFLFGAIVAKADRALEQKLGRLGERVGLLYQLYDDLLDGDLALEEKDRILLLYGEIKFEFVHIFGDSSPATLILSQMLKELE